jgi:TonB-dependent starch-binding outer membrane protein SusC
MKKVLLLLSMTLLSIGSMLAQKTVTGKVTDDNGDPMVGSTITVKGTSAGTLTDADGNFSLSVPNGATTLLFSFVGFTSREEVIGSRSVINVKMTSDNLLQETVIVAYGTATNKELTGSVGKVKGKAIENVPMASIDQILQGKVAGLQSVGTTGQPGRNADVRLRGIGSINAGSSPLYVVDGVPLVEGSRLAAIDPNNIESVSVLKDADATSIYGSRGANGVILITTKRGRGDGKTTIRFDYEQGTNDVAYANEIKPLNADEYKTLVLEGLNNAGASAATIASTSTAYGLDRTSNTDWLSAVTRQGLQQQYNVAVDGGDAKTQFSVSAGVFKQQAPIVASEFSRLSGSFSLDHKLSNFVKIGLSAQGSNSIEVGPSQGGAFRNPLLSAYFLTPFQRPYNDDGTFRTDRVEYPSIYNPLAIADVDKNTLSFFRTIGSGFVTISPIKNLDITSRIGLDYTTINVDNYRNPFFGDARTTQGSALAFTGRNLNYTWTNTATYKYYLGGEKNTFINFLAGYEAQKADYKDVTAYSEGFPLTTDLTLPVIAANPKTASSSSTGFAVASVFSKVGFVYKNRYSVSASIRRDGSSRFGTNTRYGTFWSVGAAWNIDEEDFMKNNKIFSTVKLRGSYGVNGNGALSTSFTDGSPNVNGDFRWRPLYSYGANYNGSPGSFPSNPGNLDLSWELNKPLDIGFVLGIFKDRLKTEFSWYRRETSSLLLNEPLSRTSGFSSIFRNIGSMENKGIELTVEATPIATRGFKWDINFNIAFNQNKILSLNDGQYDFIDGRFIRRVGSDIQSVYARSWAGVDPANGDPLWWKDSTMTEKTNNYNTALRFIQGSASPKYFGGFSNTFSYEGFELSAQFNYSIGGKVSDAWGGFLLSDGTNPNFNRSKAQLARWQKAGDITDVPKYIHNSARNSNANSTRYLYDGDYVRLRDITFAYTLRKKIMDKIPGNPISSMKFYVRGSNLWTWVKDKRVYFDPENNGVNGLNDLQILPTKTILGGINITF